MTKTTPRPDTAKNPALAKDTQKIFPGSPEILTIMEVSRLLGLNHRTVREAVRSGELESFIIGGREPRRSGRGLGYRITRDALQRWYFGESGRPKPVE